MAQDNTPGESGYPIHNLAKFDKKSVVKDNGNKEAPVMSFNKYRIFLGMKAVSYQDEKTHQYGKPTLKQSMSIDGKFFDFPTDANEVRDFANFLLKYANILEKANLSTGTVRDDEQQALELVEEVLSA